jgi:membrane-associated protein
MFNLEGIIKTAGYAGLFGIIFAESGLLIGFFLPGDSLLFTAGFLASQGYLNIWILAPLLFVAAVTGDSVGYTFGYRVGPKIFKKEDSLFFHKDHLVKAQNFFQKHGGKTIILARFLPVVRTFAPILAGVGKMRYATFLFYNVVGGLLWAAGLTFLGFFLGKVVPDIDKYLLPIVLVIIVVSIAPSAWHVLKDKSTREKIWLQLKTFWQNKRNS